MPMDKFDDIIRKKVEGMTFESNEAEVDSIVQYVRNGRPSLFKRFITSRIAILSTVLGLSLMTNMYFVTTRSTHMADDREIDNLGMHNPAQASTRQMQNGKIDQALAGQAISNDQPSIASQKQVYDQHKINTQSKPLQSKNASTTLTTISDNIQKNLLIGQDFFDEAHIGKVHASIAMNVANNNAVVDKSEFVAKLGNLTLKALNFHYLLPRKLSLLSRPITPLQSPMKKTYIGLEAAASPMDIQSSVIGQWDFHKNVSVSAYMGLGLTRNINFDNIADYENYNNETIATKYNHNFKAYKEVRDIAEHSANIFVGLGVLYRKKIFGDYNGIGGVSGQFIIRSKTYLDFAYKTSDISNTSQSRLSSSESNDRLVDFNLQLGIERQLGRYRFQLMANVSPEEQHESHHLDWSPGLIARVLYGL